MVSSTSARPRPVSMATTFPEGDLLALYDEFGRRRSDPSSPAELEDSFDTMAAYDRPQPMAPTSAPRDAPRPKSKQEKVSIRLRSNSGLSMHTNEIALRQYTDYNPDGSPRASVFGSSNWKAEQLHSVDQMSSASRTPTGGSANGSQNSLLVPDFMGRDVFQMALNNPTTLHRLLKYAQSQGCGENVEFLIKLQEYSRSLEAVTSLLSQISTNYTSIAATSPLGFPLLLSKSVNSDIKNITTTILPGLEMLFLESRCFIEQKVFKEIFPGFIRYQLAITTNLSLTQTAPPTPTWSSTDETPSGSPICDYPGLGDAFCLTDPSNINNPIIYSSDGFINVTGFNRREVARNCRFLQGPQTDKAAVKRLSTALANKQDSVELLLNYKKDGQPFWNLLYTTPVLDQNGNAKFFLGGQINISDTVSSNKDVIRILNAGATAAGETITPLPAEAYNPQDDEPDLRRNRLNRGASVRPNMTSSPPLSAMASNNGKSSSKSRFFKPFRRSPGAPTSPTEELPPGSSSGRRMRDDPRRRSYIDPSMYQGAASPPMPGLEALLMHKSTPQYLGLGGQIDQFHTAYSRHILLEYVTTPDSPASSSFSGSTKGRLSIDGPSPRKRGVTATAGSPQLLISYISRGAGELLGLGPIGYERADIFGVLEAAVPGGVGKAFRNAVRDRMKEGVAATLDMMVCRVDSGSRKGSIISKMHLEDTPQKRVDRLVSYWTPLKDVRERVGWVVVVVAPSPSSSP